MAFQLPANTHIAHVELKVADLDRAHTFYTEALGFQSRRKNGIADLFTDPDGAPLIRLTAHPGAAPKPRHTAGLFHVAVRVPGRAALARSLYRLRDRHWPLAGASDHGVSEALYLSDPDGNGLEIYTDRDRARWPMSGDRVAMFSAPLDLNALLREGSDDSAPALPARTDIGHVHLQVSSLEKAETFYCNLLGFDITQQDYRGALFVAAGGYHHHLGLNVWAGEGVAPAPENAAGLKAFTLAVPDLGTRNAIRERLETANIAVEPTPNGLKTQDFDRNTVIIADAA